MFEPAMSELLNPSSHLELLDFAGSPDRTLTLHLRQPAAIRSFMANLRYPQEVGASSKLSEAFWHCLAFNQIPNGPVRASDKLFC